MAIVELIFSSRESLRQSSNFFKKRPSVFFGFGVVNKNSAAAASYFFGRIPTLFDFTGGKFPATTDTSSLRKKPGLDRGNDVFKHYHLNIIVA